MTRDERGAIGIIAGAGVLFGIVLIGSLYLAAWQDFVELKRGVVYAAPSGGATALPGTYIGPRPPNNTFECWTTTFGKRSPPLVWMGSAGWRTTADPVPDVSGLRPRDAQQALQDWVDRMNGRVAPAVEAAQAACAHEDLPTVTTAPNPQSRLLDIGGKYTVMLRGTDVNQLPATMTVTGAVGGSVTIAITVPIKFSAAATTENVTCTLTAVSPVDTSYHFDGSSDTAYVCTNGAQNGSYPGRIRGDFTTFGDQVRFDGVLTASPTSTPVDIGFTATKTT
jgi:hypothetical protein